MNVSCPGCGSIYRVDPARVPAAGVVTRCRDCGDRFRIGGVLELAPGEVAAGEAVPHDGGMGVGAGSPIFGPQDPDIRARRLARALVSDIKVYHPERWADGLRLGTLRREFRDEILRSWDEFVDQVGESMAKRTPYFRDALNEILADGAKVF